MLNDIYTCPFVLIEVNLGTKSAVIFFSTAELAFSSIDPKVDAKSTGGLTLKIILNSERAYKPFFKAPIIVTLMKASNSKLFPLNFTLHCLVVSLIFKIYGELKVSES